MAVALAAGAVAAPAHAAPKLTFQGEHGTLPNTDARVGSLAPTGAQLRAADRLGAEARWTRFGTPRSLTKTSGVLAKGYAKRRPNRAARAFLTDNRRLFRLSRSEVRALRTVNVAKVGKGRTVLLGQRLGGLEVTNGGMVAVALRRGKVLYASSSLTGNTAEPPAATLSATEAWLKAAADVGRSVDLGALGATERKNGWTTFEVPGLQGLQRARLAAFPTPTEGNRAVFETIVIDAKGSDHGVEAYTHYVDAVTGKVWARSTRVEYLSDNPRWKVFPSSPSMELVTPLPANPGQADPAIIDYADTDIRQVWCWQALRADDEVGEACQRVLFNEQQRTPMQGEWDRFYDPLGDSLPSFTSLGNNANAGQARLSPLTGSAASEYRYVAPDREYLYPWEDQWNNAACNPSQLIVPGVGADIDAAIANLFSQHNRMHDWSYHLGFQEQTWNLQQFNFGREFGPGVLQERPLDPEYGGAQAGALTGGNPSFLGRDNANQITLNDGIPGITNMYLWQPIQAAFYAPCVDGDYDMSVIGHEYTHAISNRMAAGPEEGLVGRQARSMGESWSDLAAMEYLNEYGFTPVSGENPFAVGPYVTGDKQAGIRNYGMNASPLNWSNIGYDVTGPQVHADGEIWSATNFDLRQAFIGKYGAGNRELQTRCANGRTPVANCPGNRRWIATMFAAWLLMQPDVDMQDARDAYMAANTQLFGSDANGGPKDQDIMWRVFANRGLGSNADNADSRDGDSEEIIDEDEADPEPSFEMPAIPFAAQNAKVTFKPIAGDGVAPRDVRIFVGDYEARTTPVADTIDGEDDPGRNRPTSRLFAPGTYRFVATAPGFGHVRFTRTFKAGQTVTVPVTMYQNLASLSNGATATSTGANPKNLLDDTEDTQWQGNGPPSTQRVTVALDNGQGGKAPGTQAFSVRRVRVSALLRPAEPLEGDPFDQDPSQSRFAALRSFEIWTCTATALTTCSTDAEFTKRYTSPADAFPAVRPRPRAPQLIIRSFDVPDANATHVQLRVVDNQCTGTPDYHGEQDADPMNTTDCRSGSVAATRTFAAELQVLKSNAPF